MNFKIGEKVRYLNEVGGGVVTRIIDDKTIEIENEYGFNVPVAKKELIKISEEETKEEDANIEINEAEKKQDPLTSSEQEKMESYVTSNSYNYAERDQWDYIEENDKETNTEAIIDDNKTNIYIAFVPESNKDIGDSDLKIFLINDSNYQILYNVSIEQENEFINVDSGELEENIKTFISSYKIEDISKISNILVQIIFYKKTYFSPKPPINEIVKIKPTKFFKDNSFIENDYFDNNAILIPVYSEKEFIDNIEKLTKHDIKKIIEEKRDIKPDTNSKHKIKKIDKKQIVEVDLHINNLIDNHKGLSNGEIINIQLNHFKKNLENAIANKVEKIVFIHGVGNGTLKFEIHKILEESYPFIPYQDASFKEYGYGATMILIKH